MTKKLTILLLATLLSFSCSSNKKKDVPSAEKNYLEAYKSLRIKNYSEAGDLFDKIDDDFPFSKWGPKAKTMAVYARYKNEEYDKLTQIVDDFTRLNPISEHNPYLLYMKGRAYFNKIPHIKRAQDDSQVSSYVFRELIARYPHSDYAIDAKTRLSYIDEHIAGHIMEIGRDEIKKKNYIGALKHFTKVSARYRYTKQISESYFRIYEIFTKLGIHSEAQKAKNTLTSKYPNSYWAESFIPKSQTKTKTVKQKVIIKDREITLTASKKVKKTPSKVYRFSPTKINKQKPTSARKETKVYKFPR